MIRFSWENSDSKRSKKECIFGADGCIHHCSFRNLYPSKSPNIYLGEGHSSLVIIKMVAITSKTLLIPTGSLATYL